MRCLKPLTATWGARLHAATLEAVRCCLSESQETSGRRVTRARATRFMRTRRRYHSRAARVCSRPARAANGLTEFQVDSSNRFSAQAEVAHETAGHALPWQREARFPPATTERSFVPAHASHRRPRNPNSSHHPHAPDAPEPSPLSSRGLEDLRSTLNNYSARTHRSPALFPHHDRRLSPGERRAGGSHQESKIFSCRKN